MAKKVLAALVIFVALALPQSATATPIALGVMVFDTFIPGPDGTNAFFISNLTGPFALLPDFPVATSITFESPSLSWLGPAGSPYDFGGAGIGPGTLDPAFPIQFSDIVSFASATFTALLSTSVFELGDGRVFQAASSLITAQLTNLGGVLTPGDFLVLSTEAEEIATVPEPATLMLLASGLAAYTAVRGRARRRQSSRA